MFKKLLKEVFGCGLTYDPTKYVALREYKNFDFCICEKIHKTGSFEPGCIVFVLENKCKSIPYKQQLEKYQEDVNNYNKKYRKKDGFPQSVEPQFTLLHLVKEFAGKKDILNEPKWNLVSYERYADFLQKYIDNSQDKQFKEQIIEQYVRFISCLDKYFTPPTRPQNIVNKYWSIINAPKELSDLRIGDIWQKCIANMIVLELKEKLETKKENEQKKYNVVFNVRAKDLLKKDEYSNGTISLIAGFTHGQALIDVKYKKGDNLIYGIQIQGKQYRYVVETVNENPQIEERLQKVWGKKITAGYNVCRFGKTFKYYHRDIDTARTVENVIQDIIDDIADAKKIEPKN